MPAARAWAALLALCALPSAADELRVVSVAPDQVTVTIYRDLFALVTETRTVELPEGPVTLEFDGVVEALDRGKVLFLPDELAVDHVL